MKKELNVQIGKRVGKVRRERGLSQNQLAERLGVSTLFVSYIECGQKGMSIDTLIHMCGALHVSSDYLLLRQENAEGPADVYTETVRLLQEADPRVLPLLKEQICLILKVSEIGCRESK